MHVGIRQKGNGSQRRFCRSPGLTHGSDRPNLPRRPNLSRGGTLIATIEPDDMVEAEHGQMWRGYTQSLDPFGCKQLIEWSYRPGAFALADEHNDRRQQIGDCERAQCSAAPEHRRPVRELRRHHSTPQTTSGFKNRALPILGSFSVSRDRTKDGAATARATIRPGRTPQARLGSPSSEGGFRGLAEKSSQPRQTKVIPRFGKLRESESGD